MEMAPKYHAVFPKGSPWKYPESKGVACAASVVATACTAPPAED